MWLHVKWTKPVSLQGRETGWTSGYWQQSGLQGSMEMGYNLFQTWHHFQQDSSQAPLPPGRAYIGGQALAERNHQSQKEGRKAFVSKVYKSITR